MVDALAALDTLDWSLEARKQVILADRLVVSKCDLISQSSLERVIDRLRLLNPRAPMHTATAGDLDPHCLTAGRDGPADSALGLRRRIAAQ